MPKNILAQNIDCLPMPAFPNKDFLCEVILMEVTGEHVERFGTLQNRWYHTTWIQPVVEHKEGLLCFQGKATMEDVGELHR